MNVFTQLGPGLLVRQLALRVGQKIANTGLHKVHLLKHPIQGVSVDHRFDSGDEVAVVFFGLGVWCGGRGRTRDGGGACTNVLRAGESR